MIATRGHVRDLPSKAGSVDPEGGFAMAFESGKGALRPMGASRRDLCRDPEGRGRVRGRHQPRGGADRRQGHPAEPHAGPVRRPARARPASGRRRAGPAQDRPLRPVRCAPASLRLAAGGSRPGRADA